MAEERDIEHLKPETDAEDERPVVDESDDDREIPADAPEADVVEQRQPTGGRGGDRTPALDREANEADVLEQAEEVGGDDDEWE